MRKTQRLSHPIVRIQKERKGHPMGPKNPLRRGVILPQGREGEDLQPIAVRLVNPLQQWNPLLATGAEVGEPEDYRLVRERIRESERSPGEILQPKVGRSSSDLRFLFPRKSEKPADTDEDFPEERPCQSGDIFHCYTSQFSLRRIGRRKFSKPSSRFQNQKRTPVTNVRSSTSSPLRRAKSAVRPALRSQETPMYGAASRTIS